MKKFLCVMLSIALMLSCTAAFAAVEYTLPEKWQRQVDFGNGIKGTLTLNVSGETDWAQLLAPMSGVEMQIRAIHSDDRFQYRLYVEDGENMVGLTQLYGDEDAVYLKSDLLPDMLLTMATGGDLLDRLTGGSEGTNPSLYSAMMNIANVPQTSWEGKWLPALGAYEESIELWLEDYASAPSVKRGENGATVLVRYDVPADAVKAQMKVMWAAVLQDATLLPLLRAQMNEKQQAAFLNANLMYYYEQVIDGINLTGNVVLEREMTAKGEIVRTDMTFPLTMDGWNALRVSQVDGYTALTLQGDAGEVELQLEEAVTTPDSAGYKGKLRVTYTDDSQQDIAAAFTLVEIRSSSVDADTRSHEVTTWTLKLRPDEEATGEGWMSFEPVELYAKTHLHSKELKYNAVSFELELAARWEDAEISAVVDLITRSPWVLDVLPTEGAVEISTLPEGELTQLLIDMGLNGITRVMMMNEQNIADAATVTDLPASTTDLPASTTDIAPEQ